ncbi:MAG: molybdopterin-dependent oxidoreductase [Aliishimia sp.]
MSFMNTVFVAFSVLTSMSLPVLADTLSTPKGDVILTISGNLNNTTMGSPEGTVTLDLEALKALDTKTFTTSTIWIEGEIEFTGVSLGDLLEYAGAIGPTIGAIASNDYKVDIPVDGLEANAPIVAYLMNGEEMSARGKGPLWIVYPYDDDAKYRTEVIYSRSIWQLDRLVSTK